MCKTRIYWSKKTPVLHIKAWPNARNISMHHCCMMLRHVLNGLAKRTQHIGTAWPNVRNMLCPTMLQDVALKCCERLARPLGKREFKKRRRLRLRHRHKTVISLVKRAEIIMLHVQHGF